MNNWICCQLGAREHYAIPRALHQGGQLTHLITDAWVTPNSALNFLPKPLLINLRERFHVELNQAAIDAFTASLIQFELNQKIQKTAGWQRMIARNYWFQQRALDSLQKISNSLKSPLTLFAYSYAALELFRYAKSQGWRTVLGQIDPGVVEEKLVLAEHLKYPIYQSNKEAAPPEYWANWQQECLLADRIIVNSQWSRQALEQVGIPQDKIEIIPLAYQPPPAADSFVRSYPQNFSLERPMKVLFLGQVILRKGIAPLLEAAEKLRHQPIEFWLVGSPDISILPKSSNIRWIGAVPRSITAQYYQQADVFLFPTLSDGFGLTQLEAQAWRLPIIASKFCGDVVKQGVNGILLEEVSGNAIAKALKSCLENPCQLEVFSKQSTDISHFNLLKLRHSLEALSFSNS
jgi:glycosyltransferase involved in cell wall biosynthesis